VQVPRKPFCGEPGRLIERSRLLKQMRGTRDDGQLLRASEMIQGVLVEREHFLVAPAHDEQRRAVHTA
jgi:hypothetical protein